VATMASFIKDDRSAAGAAGAAGESRTCSSYTTCVTENTYLSSCPLEDWEIMVYLVTYGLIVVCVVGPLVAWIVLRVKRMMVGKKKKEEAVGNGTVGNGTSAGQKKEEAAARTASNKPPSVPLEIDS
jgi:hypothetical protein